MVSIILVTRRKEEMEVKEGGWKLERFSDTLRVLD
jgi:hypothetical protein